MTGTTYQAAGFLVTEGKGGFLRAKEILWGEGLPRFPRGIAATENIHIAAAIARYLGKRGWGAADLGVIIQEGDRDEAMRFPISAFSGLLAKKREVFRCTDADDVWCVLHEYPAMVARLAADGFAEAWSLDWVYDTFVTGPGENLPTIKTVDPTPRAGWSGRARHGATLDELRGLQGWEGFATILDAANADLPNPIVNVRGIKSSTNLLRRRMNKSAADMNHARQAFVAAMIHGGVGSGHIPGIQQVPQSWLYQVSDDPVAKGSYRLLMPGGPESFPKWAEAAFGEAMGNLLAALMPPHLPIGKALLPHGKLYHSLSLFRSECSEADAPFDVALNFTELDDVSAHQRFEAASLLEELLVRGGLSEEEAQRIVDAARPQM